MPAFIVDSSYNSQQNHYQNRIRWYRIGTPIGYSDEAGVVFDELHNPEPTQALSRLTQFNKFCNLAATWKEETRHLSSITDLALNPSYQEIIGMGKEILPDIFRELEREPDQWFWALKSITGVDPVRSQDRGDFDRIVQSWINWGKEHGYV